MAAAWIHASPVCRSAGFPERAQTSPPPWPNPMKSQKKKKPFSFIFLTSCRRFKTFPVCIEAQWGFVRLLLFLPNKVNKFGCGPNGLKDFRQLHHKRLTTAVIPVVIRGKARMTELLHPNRLRAFPVSVLCNRRGFGSWPSGSVSAGELNPNSAMKARSFCSEL